MPENDFQVRARLRWCVYALLITLSVGVMLARVMSVTARHQRTPFQSANDKSRIATVRALVEHGTYAIDEIIVQGETKDHNDDGHIDSGDWHTIDMVRHTDREGVMRSYSSKPTLLPTLLAGEYWAIYQVTGMTLGEEPFYVARIMLVITNVLPMLLYLCVMAYLIDQWGATDWGRLFAMAVATFGTFLPTFAVTINNHLPATISCSLAVLAALKIWYDGEECWNWFALTGVFGAFTAANELPALSFFCLLSAALLVRAPIKALSIHVPAALIVVAGVFGTNYLAHNDWATPYAHRDDGKTIAELELPVASELDQLKIPAALREIVLKQTDGREITEEAVIEVDESKVDESKQPIPRWVYSDHDETVRFAIERVDNRLEVREWNDWYRFAGAYWRSGNEDPIDDGEESALAYAFHCTFGHHGVFSLTPVWLLAVVGLGMLIVGGNSQMRSFALFVAILSCVVLGFYLSRPVVDRTYGGWTCGLRWMFWFAPMWLLMLLPAADWTARSRWLQGVALVMLLLSAFSAFYASDNPWTHPWLYDYWVYLGWIGS